MLVRMLTQIGGHRNGEEWPARGGTIDVPDHEAHDLVLAGYGEIVAAPEGLMTPDEVRAQEGLDAETATDSDESTDGDEGDDAGSKGRRSK